VPNPEIQCCAKRNILSIGKMIFFPSVHELVNVKPIKGDRYLAGRGVIFRPAQWSLAKRKTKRKR